MAKPVRDFSQEELAAFLEESSKVNDQFYSAREVAAARRYSSILGVDEQNALDHPDDVRRIDHVRKGVRALDSRPAVVNWLQKGSNALIASDDIDTLSYFDQLTNSVKRGYHGILDVKSQLDLATYGSAYEFAKKHSKDSENIAAHARVYESKLKDTFKSISEREKVSRELGYSTFQKKFSEAKDVYEGLRVLKNYPLQAALDILPQSAVLSAPATLLAILSGGGAATFAGAAAMGGFLTDYASHFREVANDLGINLSSHDSVAAAWQSPYLRSELTRRSLSHGLAVGLASGVAGYLAGSSSLIAKNRALADSTGTVSQLSKKAIALEAGKQAASQAALGAGGEYAGQRLAKEPISGKEIALEGIAEVAGAPGEIAAIAKGKDAVGNVDKRQAVADDKQGVSQQVVPEKSSDAQEHEARVSEMITSSGAISTMNYHHAIEWQKTGDLQDLVKKSLPFVQRSKLKEIDPVLFKDFVDDVDENFFYIHPQRLLDANPSMSSVLSRRANEAIKESSLMRISSGDYFAFLANDSNVSYLATDPVVASQIDVSDYLEKRTKHLSEKNKEKIADLENHFESFKKEVLERGQLISQRAREVASHEKVSLANLSTAIADTKSLEDALRRVDNETKTQVSQLTGTDKFSYQLLNMDMQLTQVSSQLKKSPNNKKLRQQYDALYKEREDMRSYLAGSFSYDPSQSAKAHSEVLDASYQKMVRGFAQSFSIKESAYLGQLYLNFFDSLASVSGIDISLIIKEYMPSVFKYASHHNKANGKSVFKYRGKDKDFSIHLFANSDMKTMIHETGHVFLEIFQDIAKNSDRPEPKKYLNHVLRWLKYDGKKITTAQHEKFANGFVSYLQGSEPKSAKVIELFRVFKDWLIASYRSTKRLVEIPSEVSAVLDTLLKNKEEVTDSVSQYGFLPMLDDRLLLPKQMAAYQKAYYEYIYHARESLDRESLKSLFTQPSSKDKEMAAKIVADLPVMKTEQLIRSTGGVSAASVKSSSHLEALTKKGLIANTPGASSIDEIMIRSAYPGKRSELLSQLSSPVSRDTLERAAASYLHLSRQGSGSYVKDILSAVLNDKWIEFLALELGLVGSIANEKSGNDLLAMIIDHGLETHRTKDVANADTVAILSGVHNAFYKENIVERAAASWHAQLAKESVELYHKLSGQLSKSQRYQTNSGKSSDFLKSHLKDISSSLGMTRNGVIADEDNQIAPYDVEKLISSFDFIRDELKINPPSAHAVKKLVSQGKLLNEISNEEAQIVSQYFEEIDGIAKRHAIDVDVAVEKFSESQLSDKKKRLEQTMQLTDDPAALTAISRQLEDLSGVKNSSRVKSKLSQTLQKMRFKHLKMSTLIHILDGNIHGGYLWDKIARPANELASQEKALKEEAFSDLSGVLKPLFTRRDMYGDGKWYQSIGKSLNSSEKLSLLLNLGNAGNRKRLLEGLKVQSIEDIDDVLVDIDDELIKVSQTIFDYFDSLHDTVLSKLESYESIGQVAAMDITLPRADGSSVTTRGGYYHILYDKSQEGYGKNMTVDDFEDGMSIPGELKSRSEDGQAYPIKLDLSNIFTTVNRVIHFSVWHRWVQDVKMFLLSDGVRSSMTSAHGAFMWDSVNRAVDDIAKNGTEELTAFDQVIAHLRRNIVVSRLGLNPRTILVQLGSFIPALSAQNLGAKYVLHGFTSFLSNPSDSIKTVNGLSKIMRQRSDAFSRDINDLQMASSDEMLKSAIGKDKIRIVQNWMMAPLRMVMKTQDYPVWLGSYQKFQDAGFDEETAADLADQMVLDVIGGSHRKDTSEVQHGNELLKMFTVFYSFFNTAYNLYVRADTNPDKDMRKMHLAQHVLYTVLLTSVADAALRELFLQASNPEADEFTAEGFLGHIGNTVIQQVLGAWLGVRELSNAFAPVLNPDEAYPYKGLTALSVVGDFYAMIANLVKEDKYLQKMKSINNVAADIIGYPAAPLRIAIQNLFENFEE